MNAYKREIVIFIIAALATLSAVWYFFGKMEKTKTTAQTDLYTLVAPASEAVLGVNRPDIFAKYMLSDSSVRQVFASRIPPIYLSLIREYPGLPELLFSFHAQGVLFYTKATEAQVSRMEEHSIKKKFSSFAPQKQGIGPVTFIYYPDTGNRFFGYYQYNGIFVASYSRKLLEEVARIQTKPIRYLLPEQETIRRSFDRNAPLNLMFGSDSLNLYVTLSDSTEWRIRGHWLGADLFMSKGNLCYFGSIPYEPEADSLYTALGDTLSLRLKQLFPQLPAVTSQFSIDNGQVLYTGCNK